MRNIALYISRRITKNNLKGKQSGTMVNIAITSVAISVAVILISVAILIGFQNQIKTKIADFNSHIQIMKFGSLNNLESNPIDKNNIEISKIRNLKEVKNISPYVFKAGIIKADEQIQGVVLKGIDLNFQNVFFENNLIEGNTINFSDTSLSTDICISNKIAQSLNLKLNDDLRIYFFVDNNIRGRKFNIKGIFNSGLNEIDGKFLFCDIKQLQRLNGWDENMVSGVEIQVEHYKDVEKNIYQIAPFVDFDMQILSIQEIYPQIFDWLALQDTNVIVIITLMTLVSAMAIISTLLIIILERTSLIGLLKALGAKTKTIRNIFLNHAAIIILKGLLWGNIIGLGLCFMQKYLKIIKLNPETYFMSYVPIDISFWNILIINLAALIICLLVLLIPATTISKISPSKAIKIE